MGWLQEFVMQDPRCPISRELKMHEPRNKFLRCLDQGLLFVLAALQLDAPILTTPHHFDFSGPHSLIICLQHCKEHGNSFPCRLRDDEVTPCLSKSIHGPDRPSNIFTEAKKPIHHLAIRKHTSYCQPEWNARAYEQYRP